MTRQSGRPKHGKPSLVIGADGDVITRGSLPSASTRHWRIRIKAKVVAAVESGLITREEACARYHMSDEEYLEWRRRVKQSSLAGCVSHQAKGSDSP